MVPVFAEDENYDAISKAKRFLASDPLTAAENLRCLADEYLAAGHIIPSLEARKYECFALINLMNLKQATQVAEQFLKEATDAGEQRYVGISQMYIGVIAQESGNNEYAIELFEGALTIAHEIKDKDLLSRVQLNLGTGFFNLECYETAVESFKAAAESSEPVPGMSGNGTAYYSVANGYSMVAFTKILRGLDASTEIAQSEAYLEKAWHTDRTGEVTKLFMRCCESLLWALKGEPEYGIRGLETIELELGSKPIGSVELLIWTTRCCIYELTKDWQELLRCALHAVEIAELNSTFRVYGQSLTNAANAEAHLGNFERAYRYLKLSADIAKERIGQQTTQRTQLLGIKLEVQKSKFEQQVLRMRNQFLVERNRVLEHEVKIDRLTNVLNRRGIEEELVKVSKERNFTVGLLDIDFFKHVNDSFGHDIGDATLQQFAFLLVNSEVQPTHVGRWGGEEFLIVLSSQEPSWISTQADLLLHEIRSFDWSSIHPDMKITTSLGLAMHTAGEDIYGTIKICDENLYEAKRGGRDRWISQSILRAA